MYLPKSKYSIKQASKGKFIYQVSKKAFEGEYILLSDGDMFAGNQTLNIKGDTKIIPITKEKKDNTYILHNERNNNYFNNLLKTKRISKFQDNLTPIINTKPTPLEKDYVKGYFYRYFAKRRNSDNDYYEINKKTYNSIYTKEKKYDYNLHSVNKIKWDLTDDSGKNNKTTIKKLRGPFPRLKYLFNNALEYHLSNEILNPIITPKNINAPKPKLPLNNRKSVVEAQQGAIDIIKEKSRKKYNKSSGNGNSPNITPSSGGGGGGY